MEANSKEYPKLQEKSALRLEKMTDRFLSRVENNYSGKIQEEKTVNYIKHLWAFFKFEELVKIFAFIAVVLG